MSIGRIKTLVRRFVHENTNNVGVAIVLDFRQRVFCHLGGHATAINAWLLIGGHLRTELWSQFSLDVILNKQNDSKSRIWPVVGKLLPTLGTKMAKTNVVFRQCPVFTEFLFRLTLKGIAIRALAGLFFMIIYEKT